jgi:hypothetical protein
VEAVDGVLEAVAPDEPHGVERPAAAVGPEPVDGDDPRVLQVAGDPGLQEEPLAADGVVGVAALDLLQRDLAVQLLVQRDEHLAEPPLGVRSEDPEPRGGGRGARRKRGGGVGRDGGRVRGEAVEGGGQRGVAEAVRPPAGGLAGGEGGESAGGVAPVPVEVLGGQCLQQGAPRGGEGAGVDQGVGDGAAVGVVDGSGEVGRADQVVVEGEQADHQVAGRVIAAGHGSASRPPAQAAAAVPVRPCGGSDAGGRRP